MKMLVFSASPNTDGLTAGCAAATSKEIQEAGGEGHEVRINDLIRRK